MVVFDIIKKLYELNVSGNKSAKKEIEQIERFKERSKQETVKEKLNLKGRKF